MILLSLVAAALLQPVEAEPLAPAPDIVTLSPADRAAALEAGAGRPERELPINGLGAGVHGEVGTSIDSRGGHAVYGTARVPLGQTGAATFSILDENSGHWRPR